ncbi:MAG: tetratricopeptide repeat protein [Acidimicrobiales bacterium]|nr:tetratricopeptide repeat protein [Hyphomonadaceae bacterium]RZV41170.1 MAG: tetratricopeptide repeat protein [Acidimicrobiales bacterium]
MVDFINEVEEELRKDKYNDLLKKFGPLIVTIIVAIVAVAGYVEYKKYSDGVKARKASASFVAADKLADEGDLQAAIDKFLALAEVSPEGYTGLSYSRAAALKVQLGDMDGAVNLFDRAAGAFTKPIHKDLASLKAAYILMDEGRYDDVKARANSLSVDDAPYADLAKELLAHAALQSGDEQTARTQFTYLSNVPGVLNGVKMRAEQSLLLMNASRAVPAPTLEESTEDLEVPTPGVETPEAPQMDAEQAQDTIEDPQ